MDALLIGSIILLFVVNVAVLFILFNRKQDKGNGEGLSLIQQQLGDLSRTVDERLGKGTEQMFESMKTQFSESQRLATDIRDTVTQQLLEVAKGVSETKESTRQVFTIAEQLSNLEKVLKNQKQRGNLGETSLELILSNVLAGQYQSQYPFNNGEKVDMVVKTTEGLVPIDVKFPLENYVRFIDEPDDGRKEEFRKNFRSDVKKRIDETAKYIRPEEGTTPFAIMFIPAEGIYYDLLNNGDSVGVNSRDLIDYAFQEKNVLIASPTTFLVYLQTVLFGNKRVKIQEAAKDIMKNVGQLDKHLKAYEKHHSSLGKSLVAAMNHYESSGTAFRLVDKDILKIEKESPDFLLTEPEKPNSL